MNTGDEEQKLRTINTINTTNTTNTKNKKGSNFLVLNDNTNNYSSDEEYDGNLTVLYAGSNA